MNDTIKEKRLKVIEYFKNYFSTHELDKFEFAGYEPGGGELRLYFYSDYDDYYIQSHKSSIEEYFNDILKDISTKKAIIAICAKEKSGRIVYGITAGIKKTIISE